VQPFIIRFGIFLFFALHVLSCSIKPGSLKKLSRAGITTQAGDFGIGDTASFLSKDTVDIVYLGSGGILVLRSGEGILIDPFFSNQPFGRIGKSLFLRNGNKKTIRSDPEMIAVGVNTIAKASGPSWRPLAILNAHSHYDHLMDIPAIYNHYGKGMPVLLNRTACNICHAVIDSSDMVLLENHMTTQDVIRDPIHIPVNRGGEIRVYPIRSDHNPHFRYVSFFSGEHTRRVDGVSDPLRRTAANLWLEGQTFSFLIDYISPAGDVQLRLFIQSSSCNPPAGIPPEALLERPVDIALLGVVSYHFSPDYPCTLLDAINPKHVVWIHWEDFFRKYTKEPKTVRGTDFRAFFELPCVREYKNSGKMLWPGVKMRLVY
jgi:hypothetical protein